MCPKFTWNVLVGGLTEWYLNTSNMCLGPGRLAFPSLLEHTKHCFAWNIFLLTTHMLARYLSGLLGHWRVSKC